MSPQPPSRAKPPKEVRRRAKEPNDRQQSTGEDLNALERAVDFKFFGRGSKTGMAVEEDGYEFTKPLPKTRGPNVPKVRFTGFQLQNTKHSSDDYKYEHEPNELGHEKSKGDQYESLSDRKEKKSILLGKLLRGGKRGTKEAAVDKITGKEEPQKVYHNTLVKQIVDVDDIFDDENDPDESYKGGTDDDAIPTFRLRRPANMNPEQQMAIKKAQEDKEIALIAREHAQKEKRKLKRSLESNRYLKFNFEDTECHNLNRHELFSTKTFIDIGVRDQMILENLESMSIFNPTKIQELTIPSLSKGRGTLIQAQTGSGKTLSFLLPLADIIDRENKKVQAIILAPSRELVTQIASVGDKLFKNTDIRIMPIIGGANVRGQIQRMRVHRPQIIVATPGRMAEIVFGLEKLKLNMIKAVVIDEVDNMLREPYAGEIQTILEGTPLFKRRPHADVGSERSEQDTFGNAQQFGADGNKSQMVCFASATGSSHAVKDFINNLYGVKEDTKLPWETISIDSKTALPPTINHGLISCPRIKALEMLKRTINSKPEVRAALIFVNDPHRVEIVCDKLLEMGIIAAPLHGDTNKDDRKDILARLRDGRLPLVVTTELAARGIDVPDLTHVINFELPTDAQHYVHRAGRCGRAGTVGLVINFATPDTKFVIRRFGKQLGIKVRDCELREGHVYLKM